MRDLAHIRVRDVWYPTGNLMNWFRYYSECSGTPLDKAKLSYYSVIGMLTPALALGPAVQQMDPRDEHAEWIAQNIWSKKATAQALAEAAGIELHPIALLGAVNLLPESSVQAPQLRSSFTPGWIHPRSDALA